MFLTRIGFGSKVVVTGDTTQVDVPGGRSGLVGLERMLAGIDGLAFVHLDERATSCATASSPTSSPPTSAPTSATAERAEPWPHAVTDRDRRHRPAARVGGDGDAEVFVRRRAGRRPGRRRALGSASPTTCSRPRACAGDAELSRAVRRRGRDRRAQRASSWATTGPTDVLVVPDRRATSTAVARPDAGAPRSRPRAARSRRPAAAARRRRDLPGGRRRAGARARRHARRRARAARRARHPARARPRPRRTRTRRPRMRAHGSSSCSSATTGTARRPPASARSRPSDRRRVLHDRPVDARRHRRAPPVLVFLAVGRDGAQPDQPGQGPGDRRLRRLTSARQLARLVTTPSGSSTRCSSRSPSARPRRPS